MDVPELFKLLCDRVVEPEREDCLAVTTQLKSAQLDQAESGLELPTIGQGPQVELLPSNTEQEPEFTRGSDLGATFDDNLFDGGWEKQHLTRQQKCMNKLKYVRFQRKPEPEEVEPEWGDLNLSTEEMQRLQNEDPTLASIRAVTDSSSDPMVGEGFFVRNGRLYCR